MDYLELITEQNLSWENAKNKLLANDIKKIGDKDTIEGKRLEFLSLRYFKRSDLIKKSSVYFAYTFKEYKPEGGCDHHFPTWLVFSPDLEFKEHPEKLKGICDLLIDMKTRPRKEARNKKLWGILGSNFSEAWYLPLPDEITNGKPVYLQTAYCRLNSTPDLKLGLNLILANQGVSKEVLYLPQQYWTKNWAEAYFNKEDENG